MESRPLLPHAHSSRSARSSRSHSRSRGQRRAPPVYAYPAIITVTLFIFASFAALGLSSCSPAWVCRALGDEPDTWKRNSGPYAPFSAAVGSVPKLPPGCRVDQATVLHRHTDRYPTEAHASRLRGTLRKIAARTGGNRRELAFLEWSDLEMSDWKFETLTDVGRRTAWESGVALRRYVGLLPFARASGSERVVETAGLVMQGLEGREYDPRKPGNVDLVVREGEDANNTLSVHNCRAFREMSPVPGEKERAGLLPFLGDGVARLNGLIQPNPRFEEVDLVHIADMCGFDTARAGWSPWCRVLAGREWDVVGYLADVERWYRVGAGGRYGKIMGSGWVNELIARLTDSEVKDETCTNRTLDSDPVTFPRGGERLFIDFTHDNEMIEIMTAMGIKRLRFKLPTTTVPPPESRERERFRLSGLIPFGARWVFERVVCGDDERYVRILVNDHPARVDHMACRSSAMYEHSMCEIGAFVESQAWAREEVDWGDCL